MLTWRYFCSSNGTIIDDESEQTVVVGAVLGQCFQELVTFTGSAVIIAAYATYVLIGLRYHRSYGVEMNIEAAASEKRGICIWHGEWLRRMELMAIVACIALPIVQLVGLNRNNPAWILFTAVNMLAWVLYAAVLEQYPESQLSIKPVKSFGWRIRAPLLLRLSGALLSGVAIYNVWSMHHQHFDFSQEQNAANVALACCYWLHTLLALISPCIAMSPKYACGQVFSNTNGSIQASESEPLIRDFSSHDDFFYRTYETKRGPYFNYSSVERVGNDLRCHPAESKASWFSKLIFQWADPLLHYGYLCQVLRSVDLLALPKDLDTKQLCDRFCACVFALRQSHSDKHFVLRAFNRCYGWQYYPLAILKLLADASGFAGPLLLHELVQLIDDGSAHASRGYMYAGLLCVSTAFGSLCNIHYSFQVNRIQVAIRAAITSSVFRKALRSRVGEQHDDSNIDEIEPTAILRSDDKKKMISSAGGVLNLMSTDADRLANFCPSFHQFWSLPFQIAISLYLLYLQVGISFLAGLFFALLMIPLNRWIAKRIGTLGKDLMHNKDERVKLTGEVLSAIRIVRMYAWDLLFEEKINKIRERELKALKGRKFLDAVCVYLWATTPVLISISTFATYSLLGNHLTAATVFTSMALFNVLIGPLNAFPWVLNGLVEAWVSLDRVEFYLRLKYTFGSVQRLLLEKQEMEQNNTAHTEIHHDEYPSLQSGANKQKKLKAKKLLDKVEANSHHAYGQNKQHFYSSVASQQESFHSNGLDRKLVQWNNSGRGKTMQEPAVILKDLCLVWPSDLDSEDEETSLVLRGITFALQSTEYVCLTGEVGSGKTMLLLGVLGELAPTYGTIDLSSKVIAYGIGYVPQEPWIMNATIRDNILCGRPMDNTFYNRVLKACALCDDLEFIIGGDGAELGENGVNLSGGQRARVALARAAYQQFPLYLLDNPLAALDVATAQHVIEHCICGIMANSARLLCTDNQDAICRAEHCYLLKDGQLKSIETQLPSLLSLPTSSNIVESMPNSFVAESFCHEDEVGSKKDISKASAELLDLNDMLDADTTGCTFSTDQKGTERLNDAESSQLLSEEDRVVGTVSADVYKSYSRAVGWGLAISVLLAMTLMQSSKNVSDWWLSNWVTHADKNSTSDARSYLKIYGLISAGNTVFTLLRAFLFAYAGIVAARNLHWRLLHAVLGANITFFDKNPVGRIINRFSSDINSVDDSLPFISNILLAQLFGLLGTVVIMCYSQPYFLFLLIPLSVLYYRIQRYYRQTSREVKRLGNIARSPIYAHFSESLTGVVAIRAMKMVRQFELENISRMEANQTASYNEQVVSQWLSVRLQALGVAMLTGISFLAASQHSSHNANPGLAGLAISYALSVTGVLQGLVTAFTETEKEMVCVERCDSFIQELQETTLDEVVRSPPPNWPLSGEIIFNNVYVRYKEDSEDALKDFSLVISAGENIGIQGRTGAGKSTLFRALLRMNEFSGQISIDGVDIKHLPRRSLRQAVGVIPQEPVMFSGTIRSNLDPFSLHDDTILWGVLKKCCLSDRIQSLDAAVEEQGRNLSSGERQLICLGRALLRGSRILCIDEATANVDRTTDVLIQAALRNNFADCTVLTIAHRTETLAHCDRIITIDHGRIKKIEQGTSLAVSKAYVESAKVQEY